ELLFPYDEAQRLKPVTIYKGQGCDLCVNSGYSGRSGIYEILLVDREIRQLINDSHSDLEIEDAAVAAGMKTLSMSGRSKVL
ncbi:type IV-A pilus assembly ATPase PilB, partial [Acinetobacter baumannii]